VFIAPREERTRAFLRRLLRIGASHRPATDIESLRRRTHGETELPTDAAADRRA